MKPIIEVNNVSKVYNIPHEKRNHLKQTIIDFVRRKITYEKFHALKSINIKVMPGEFLGIIGHNGSGKSTLLKLIAGIIPPTSGEIKVTGTISPFLELGVGFNDELTARENVYIYGTLLGLSKKELDKKFEEIIEFAELERFVDTKLKNYSSGMYVRLGFSVAIRANADILLVDEVLAVGDAGFRKKCYEVFENFKKQGKTVVFVSHDLEAVNQFCDRIIELQRGEIIS